MASQNVSQNVSSSAATLFRKTTLKNNKSGFAAMTSSRLP